jgi:hypothetical protein
MVVGKVKNTAMVATIPLGGDNSKFPRSTACWRPFPLALPASFRVLWLQV